MWSCKRDEGRPLGAGDRAQAPNRSELLILFRNPTDTYPEGFTTIGNYNVLPGYVTSTAYDNNKIPRVLWTGAKHAVRDDVDVAGAFYHYYQNDYNTSSCTDGGLSASSCAGTLNALSAMIDYRPAKRLDLYAGVMWTQVTGAWRAVTSTTRISAPRSVCACSFRLRSQQSRECEGCASAEAVKPPQSQHSPLDLCGLPSYWERGADGELDLPTWKRECNPAMARNRPWVFRDWRKGSIQPRDQSLA